MRPALFEKGGAKDGIEAAIDPFTEVTIGRRCHGKDRKDER